MPTLPILVHADLLLQYGVHPCNQRKPNLRDKRPALFNFNQIQNEALGPNYQEMKGKQAKKRVKISAVHF